MKDKPDTHDCAPDTHSPRTDTHRDAPDTHRAALDTHSLPSDRYVSNSRSNLYVSEPTPNLYVSIPRPSASKRSDSSGLSPLDRAKAKIPNVVVPETLIDSELRAVFRVVHALHQVRAEDGGDTFYASARLLAELSGIDKMMAYRRLGTLSKLGYIDLIKAGKPGKGATGQANTYRFNNPPRCGEPIWESNTVKKKRADLLAASVPSLSTQDTDDSFDALMKYGDRQGLERSARRRPRPTTNDPTPENIID